MKSKILVALLLTTSLVAFSQKVSVTSPNQKVIVELYNTQNAESGQWYLKVKYSIKEKTSEVIPQISLGLNRADQSFSKELKFLKVSKPTIISSNYLALHGKRVQCSNSANETVVSFENPGKA